MSWHTNPVIIGLRKVARQLGLAPILARLRRTGADYEHAFDEAMFSALRTGDTVWDVGANVGYYTKRFAEAVGSGGHVVAFEPFPATAERLRKNMLGLPNYTLRTLALGAQAGEVVMQEGSDARGATSRIVGEASDGITVEIAAGDTLVEEGVIPMPTVLKVDTEGFELEVLRGMTSLLRSPETRAVFVEVHFGLLAERGQPHAPAEIERLLKEKGFATRWVDPSHIVAQRD